jgi:hypothetical protein
MRNRKEQRMGEEKDLERRENGSIHRGIGSVQRLLNSFPMRKNAELREFVRYSKTQEKDHPEDEPLAEVFALTRKLLSKTAGILNFRLLKQDDFLETALEEVHSHLPFSIRLVLWKKRFIQFMKDHRERLIP